MAKFSEFTYSEEKYGVQGEWTLYVQGKESDSMDRGLYIDGSVTSIYTRENASDLESDDSNLATTFTEQNYTDVATDDDDFVDLEGTAQYSKFLFKEYNDNNTNGEPFTVTWKGKSSKAPSSATVYLQVYNRDDEAWESLDTDDSTGANTEFTLTGSITESLSDYYDVNYVISLRVYQEVI